MGMPTEAELAEALQAAARMRESGDDPHHLAKALFNLQYRVKHLEAVLQAAELYFRSGMAVQEEQRLKTAIRQAKASIERTGAIEEPQLGLG